jgi:hypothetical protein
MIKRERRPPSKSHKNDYDMHRIVVRNGRKKGKGERRAKKIITNLNERSDIFDKRKRTAKLQCKPYNVYLEIPEPAGNWLITLTRTVGII